MRFTASVTSLSCSIVTAGCVMTSLACLGARASRTALTFSRSDSASKPSRIGMPAL